MRKLLAALLLALLPAVAVAQQFPSVPDKTLIGRIGTGTGSGPSQAIPFGTVAPQLGIHTLPEIYAADPAYGMKCDGVTDDSAALQLALNTAATTANGTGAVVVVPSGTCEIYSNVFRNTFTSPGVLTVPGVKIRGQGRGVTILDTHVANDYAISVNPAWKAAHQAAFGATVGTSGTLATTTYYLQITINDGLGSEIVVTLPKSFSVTSPGSIAVPLPALPPGYTYNLYCDTVNNPVAHYCLYSPGGNASAVAGGQTITIINVGTAHTIPTTKVAVWQEASIRDLSITNSSGTANASGISYFKVGYSDLTNVYLKGLTGDGFSLLAYTGDVDGSFNVGIHSSKFDTISGTCVNAAGSVLELTSFTVDQLSAFNVCGTAPTNIGTNVTVSAIPNNASPVVTTSTAHNFHARDQIAFNVTGTTLASAYYRVGDTVTSNTFNLVDLNGVAVDTTSLGAFVSGTVSLAWRPPQIQNGVLTGGGGCLAWMGLLGTLRNTNFTQCNNFAFYAAEIGSSDNLTIETVDVENTAGKGFYIGSLSGGTLKNFECLGAAAFGKTVSCVQLGTGFAAGGVQNFLADVGKVRLDSATAPAIAFEQYQNTNIGATFTDTNRVRNITWQAFDATNQTRTSGFVYDSIAGMVQFSISAANTAKLIPLGYGGCLPLHLKSPGEWVCYHVPSTGITGSVTGSLTPATSYNCYAKNSAANLFPIALAFACNAHTTALNEGYSVDSTDGSYTFIGTATTDGSGNFQTSGAQTSWYPPTGASAPGNFSVGGNLTVVGTTNLGGAIVDPNGLLMTNIAAPSTPASGFDRLWTDSTDKRFHDKNDAGTIGTTVVADTGASNNFLTAISAAGVISKAQPSFSNLSGSNTAAQIAGSAASHAVPVDVAGTPTWKVISDCNGATTALNYTQSSDAFSCNSSINAATLGGATFASPGTIGGSTPAAATFTTVTANTSITDPLLLGGAAAGSTLTLQSTSGTGSGDSVLVKTGTNGSLTTARFTQTGLGVNTAANPVADFQVGGSGGTNAGFEVVAGATVQFQFFNRNSSAYAVGILAGSALNFQAGTSPATIMQVGTAALNFTSSLKLLFSVTAPTVASGFCSSPTIPNANGTASFTINVGSACAASTGTLTMPTANAGWSCTFADITTPASNSVWQTGGSSSTVVITNYSRTTGVAANFTSSDVINGKCAAY